MAGNYSSEEVEKAKEIMRRPGYPNVMEYLEALHVAYSVLGEDVTMADILRWAEGRRRDE